MVEIQLSQGKVALVDDDMAWLAQTKWCAQKHSNAHGAWYAMRRNRGRRESMHRVIMGATVGIEVDHRDGDGLNNQRENLRLATRAQNNANRRSHRRKTSTPFKGVTFTRQNGRWRAIICVKSRNIHLGYFATEAAAAEAYAHGAAFHHGEFARLS